MGKKNKKFSKILNYIGHFFILASLVTGFVLISAFASLVGIPIGITSFSVGLKFCTITTRIVKYKSINKKTKNKHGKIILCFYS